MELQPQIPPIPQPNEIELRSAQGASTPAAFVEIKGPGQSDSSGENEGGLVEYWRMLRRRKGTLILISFLGALVALLVTLPETPIYQAQSTIEIQDLNPDFMNMRPVDPINNTGYGSGMYDIDTQVKILKSSTLLDRVIAKLKLKSPQSLAPSTGRISAWRKALSLPEKAPVEAREQALGMAVGSFTARASGQTRIVDLTCDSTDPRMAAEFVNTLANEYIDQNLETRWKTTEHTSEWLSHQLEEMRIKLEKSEDSLQAYARQSGLMFTAEKTNVSEDKLRQLQTALSTAQADRIGKQSRWEIASTSSIQTLADVVDDESLSNYDTKLTDLRQQYADLSATYTPAYSKVKRVKSQIAGLETAMQAERGAILKRIKNDYEEAQRRESLLAQDYANQTRLVTDEAGKSIQYNILKREVDSNRQLYDTMLQKLKEASISSAMRASNVRVVDAAKVPGGPYKPNLPHNTGMGLFAGIILGVAFVILRERADRSIQEPGDCSFYLNVAELGVIPSEEGDPVKYFSRGRMKKYYAGKQLTAPNGGGQELLPEAKSKLPPRFELITWQRKAAVEAEAFRSALTSILFSDRKGDRPRVLLVTSSDAGEGKSTISSNLAIALAEVRQKVLLIDGDLRKPRIHDIFGVANARGLTEILEDGKGEIDLASDGWVQGTEIPSLFVLTAGRGTLSSANLLHGLHVRPLLRRLSQEFDTILIDSPPILQLPDARIWARMADAVIMVVRADKTTRDEALAARHRLSQDGSRVLGAILNDWNPKRHGESLYGYYKGYYRGYYRKNRTYAAQSE